MSAFLVSFGVIFVAELGDKSQLMALAFATRYKPLPVLVAITIATAIVHLASVAIGAVVGAALPTRPINAIAALAFVVFGLWTLRGDELTSEDEERARKTTRNVLVSVGTVFFLAELGDKTMLATVTLATREGVWEPGSARRSEWLPPTHWRSSLVGRLVRAFPSAPSRSAQRWRSSCSPFSWASKPCAADQPFQRD